jgi:hypothetical protein
MIRSLIVCVGLAIPLLASCSGASTPTARIVEFTASETRIPRNTPVTLTWQAKDAGVQDGQVSCLLTRRFGDDTSETQLQTTCTGSLTEIPPAPVTTTTAHYQLKVLKQPYDATDPYLSEIRSLTLDAALYATSAGGAGYDEATDVSALPDGSAVVAGSFRGTAAFGATTLTGAGFSDVFVARIDPDGAWTWAAAAGSSTEYASAGGVSALPGGGAIVAGQFSGTATFGTTTPITSAGLTDGFVAHVGPSGAWTWVTRVGSTNYDDAVGVSALSDGSAIVTGHFRGVVPFGTTTLTSAGDSDVFVARIDAGGVWAWATSAGGTGLDHVGGVSALPDDGAIVTGFLPGTATFGATTLTSAGKTDVFVARIDPSGTWTWATRAGGTSHDVGHGVSTLPDGGAIVTGDFAGTASFGTTTFTSTGDADVFVARIGPDGSWTWATRAGGTMGIGASGVGTLPDGGAIVAGSFGGTATFGSTDMTAGGVVDGFVARVDPTGTWTWANRARAFGSAEGVSSLADGGAIIIGYFAGNATFGTSSLASAGFADVFVARIGTAGSW